MILDMIEEWFKELLIDGIIANLTGIPHTLRAKSIHQVLPMLSECASKNSFYICIVIPARKDSSPGTRSRSPPWLSMIFRTEESPIP